MFALTIVASWKGLRLDVSMGDAKRSFEVFWRSRILDIAFVGFNPHK